MKPDAKQKLSFAVAGVVGASLRQLTPVNASERAMSAGKTNPNSASAAAARESTASMTKPSSPASFRSPAQRPAEPVNASEHQLAPVNASERETETGKTNPPSLSARQLAAARLLASGLTPTQVAQQLRMSRTGLFKWRKQPAFLAEVRRMHEWMASAYGAAVAEASRAGRARGR